MEQLSLQELNATIKSVLTKGLAASYWVVAEISELRLNPTGHCYLELVEKQEQRILAKTKATIWANTYMNLSLWFEKMTGSQLKPGMKILCNATVQYHEVFGMSLNIRDIDASFTIGEKAASRQKTINQLAEDGVLTMNKELPLNVVVQNIAIISSPTAAGYEDFMMQLNSNPFSYHFQTKLYKAVMQGNTSAHSITEALYKIHEDDIAYDIVVIIRGGGSQIDLDSYDNYDLATHIAQFPIPIVTGIGHERDESIADIVAHLSMKTPTAVAEFIISTSAEYERSLNENFQRISAIAKQEMAMHQQNLGKLSAQLNLTSKSLILNKRHVFATLEAQLQRAVKYQIHDQSVLLNALEHSLHILSPEKILKRGYSMTTSNGQLIRKGITLNEGDQLVTETYDYTIKSTVTEQKSKS